MLQMTEKISILYLKWKVSWEEDENLRHEKQNVRAAETRKNTKSLIKVLLARRSKQLPFEKYLWPGAHPAKLILQ